MREQSDYGVGWASFAPGWGNPLWWGEFGAYGPNEPVHPFRVPFGTTLDRRGGRDLPLVWTEIDLRGFRVIARYLCDTNPFAIGFVNRLIDYHIRKGFGWQACLKGVKKAPYATLEVDTPETRLVARAQTVLDQWRDANRWPVREREAFRRWRRDGEVFGRFFSGGYDRLPAFRFIEPEQIGSPVGDSDSSRSFGIHTDPDDIESVWEYYVRSMTEPGAGRWECADGIIHIKANVDGNIKRGLPDFLPVAESLDDVRRLIRSFLATAADMASIAGWERFPYATQQQIAALMPIAPNSVAQTYDHARMSGPVPVWGAYRFRPGTVIRTEGSREWQPGPTADGIPNFVQAAQAALRGCGARWGMPEYFSGDASNNNFASSLVSGSPFAVAVEGEQLAWGAGWERPTALKVLDYATDAGYFTPAERRRLDVEITEPSVVTPKPLEDTQQRQVLNAAGVLSPQTWQLKESLDPRHEAENWKAWRNARLEDGEAPPGPSQPPGFAAPTREVSEAQPGPPPRPGLVWNDSSHRWVSPETGSQEPPPPPGSKHSEPPMPRGVGGVHAEWAAASGRVKEYLAAALYNATGEEPDAKRRAPRSKVDPALLARRIASEYAALHDAGGTPEELAVMARAAAHAGVELQGEPGDTGPFDSAAYTGPAGLFPGDHVQIVRPALVHDGRIIVKGTVEPV